MNSMEVGHFIRGLKNYLESSGTTQKDFAEGVTSKVNLSNVLQGNSGTSEKMRQALAFKAGMSVESLVELGKREIEVSHIASTPDSKFNCDEVAEMNAIEIFNAVAALEDSMRDNFSAHCKQLSNIIGSLTKQRDDLITLLAAHRATVNVLEQPLMVIGKDNRVIECNRAATEKNGVYPGNISNKSDSVIQRVFLTGRKEFTKDVGRLHAYYPVLDTSGRVKNVVVIESAYNDQESDLLLS